MNDRQRRAMFAKQKTNGKTVWWVSSNGKANEFGTKEDAKKYAESEFRRKKRDFDTSAVEIGYSRGKFGKYRFSEWL